MLDDHDATFVDRIEEALCLTGHRDRGDGVGAGVVSRYAEKAAEARLRRLRQVAGGDRSRAEERGDELTESQARAEGILPVEEEDHSRGGGRRAEGHRGRAARWRRGRCGT